MPIVGAAPVRRRGRSTELQDFAFALLIGVASGAYSSIFIASPVLTHWKEREAQFTAARRADRGRAGRGARLCRGQRRTSTPPRPRPPRRPPDRARARHGVGSRVRADEARPRSSERELRARTPRLSPSASLARRLPDTRRVQRPGRPARSARRRATGAGPRSVGTARRPGPLPDGSQVPVDEPAPEAPPDSRARHRGERGCVARAEASGRPTSRTRRRHGRRR